MSDVKRYSGQMMLGETAIPAGFMRGMVKGDDYDALLAELEGERENAKEWLTEHYALQAERDQIRADLAKVLGGEYADWTETRKANAELTGEIDTLRAELEAIRGQQAVATVHSGKYASGMPWLEVEWHVQPEPSAGTKLYALPPQQPDAVSVPRELMERVAAILGSQGFSAWDELAAEVLFSTKNAEEGE